LDAFPARAPKAPSPAHAAPVTAPESLRSMLRPQILPETILHLSQRLFLQPLPYQSSGQCSPECSCQYDSNIPPVNAAAIPNPVITTAAATILAMDFQFSLHHSATDFKPSLIFSQPLFSLSGFK